MRVHHSCVQDLEQAAPGPNVAEPSSAASTCQLEQRVYHVVAMLGDISTFAAPATMSEQLDTLKTEVRQPYQPLDNDGSTSALRAYKMSTFQIEKFDDYTHQDPVVWWQGFTTEIGIHEVPNHLYISVVFLNAKGDARSGLATWQSLVHLGGVPQRQGRCQIWLSHMATIHDVQVSDLHKKISWDDMKRFIVDDAPTLAINRLFAMTQGKHRPAIGSSNGRRSWQHPILSCHFCICSGTALAWMEHLNAAVLVWVAYINTSVPAQMSWQWQLSWLSYGTCEYSCPGSGMEHVNRVDSQILVESRATGLVNNCFSIFSLNGADNGGVGGSA
ncbi:hypothetical protein CBR_g5577 [Chara braunii]|uniref:Uncharacterized protein n=1 Tax=Chara braunii TaxID=69332 RepID=A0A388JRK3_CHABU|nr:hypothetical protein CBR_g5577 [Chara braunii]|eukprot:GBG60400.1 hypothetical protein CBR_g5577 [Chara braunii]